MGKYTLKDIYLSKKVTSLVLNDFKKGQKVFEAGTNFDEVTLVILIRIRTQDKDYGC